MKCDSDIPALTPADGLIYPDAHPGNPAQALRGINPSLVIENGKVRVIAELDPFNPANGYNPKGPSKYSKEFQTRYYAAQSKVMTDQLNKVLAAKASMAKGDYLYPDDDIVLVPVQRPGRLGGPDADGSLDPGIHEHCEPAQARQERRLDRDGDRAQRRRP